MITACKAYITNNGSNSIWDQPQQIVADKIKAAIHLNQVRDGFLFLHSEAKLHIWNCNHNYVMCGFIFYAKVGVFYTTFARCFRCLWKVKKKKKKVILFLYVEWICGCADWTCNLQEYQRYFHKTKEKLEQTPSERQFDFSEMYIFGKFDTFQRRLNKILQMFGTISTYSALQDSKIEGLETMATRFQVGSLW